jgi:hypothetical protein
MSVLCARLTVLFPPERGRGVYDVDMAAFAAALDGAERLEVLPLHRFRAHGLTVL